MIGSENVFKVSSHLLDPLGRYAAVIGDHEEGKFLILSFYSPSLDTQIKDFILNHIYKLLADMDETLPDFLIIGGDSNTVLSSLDKEGGTNKPKPGAINAFTSLTERFNLQNSF